jgi:hypothetical protein
MNVDNLESRIARVVCRVSAGAKKGGLDPLPETRSHTDIARSRGSGMIGVVPPLTQDRAY